MHQRHLKLGSSVFLISFVLGCQLNFQPYGTEEFESLSQQCLSRKAVQTYKQNGIAIFNKREKVNLTRQAFTPGSMSKSTPQTWKVKQGLQLAMLINNDCAIKSPKEDILHSLLKSKFVKLRKGLQAHEVTVPTQWNWPDFQKQMESNDCIYRVTENPKIKWITQNQDPLYTDQVEYLSPIRADLGWEDFFHPVGGIQKAVTVAVIDTGIDYQHEDLKNHLWIENGKYGYDTANDDEDPRDDQGHGTMVAGFIAAQSENGLGVRGMMKDHIQIMTLKALDSQGSGTVADVADAIIWATDHGAEIINMSLGGPASSGSSSTLKVITDAIDYALSKNVTIINAAGNDSADVDNEGYWPANNGYKEGYLVVAATKAPNKTLASFSNYGNQLVQIAAPGASAKNSSGLLTTMPGNKYGRANGTSFSSPIVAGAAALTVGLLKSRGQAFTNTQVKQLLVQSASTVEGLKSYVKDGKYLDVKALARMINDGTTNIIIEQPQAQHVLVSEPVVLSIRSTAENVEYQWYKNGQPISGATGATYQIPESQIGDYGLYHVVINHNNSDFATSATAQVKVYSKLCEP
ncbi:MAG: S8 family serine peptidase [Bdellovibrionales bacterium]|nr:S8 family serine peptidase [Bdellovibrionales bacterium]